MAKLSRSIASGGPPKIVYRFLHNQNRSDRAFTTERAQKPRMANTASGRIFVTVPKDHFGPHPAENVAVRNQRLLVGGTWDMQMDCRQWGVHCPHVAIICGRAHYSAQSVVISGGYEDYEDHGEWFIYTGRSEKDKRSSYAPEKGYWYDGIYRIERETWESRGSRFADICL